MPGHVTEDGHADNFTSARCSSGPDSSDSSGSPVAQQGPAAGMTVCVSVHPAFDSLLLGLVQYTSRAIKLNTPCADCTVSDTNRCSACVTLVDTVDMND